MSSIGQGQGLSCLHVDEEEGNALSAVTCRECYAFKQNIASILGYIDSGKMFVLFESRMFPIQI